MEIRPIRWAEGRLYLLDQTRLPGEEVTLAAGRYEEAVDAIREMRVRGAPAIGVTAAYAMVMAARSLADGGVDESGFRAGLEEAAGRIRAARPTAVNLGWAVDRMLGVAALGGTAGDVAGRLLAEAERIHHEDEAVNRRMGAWGRDWGAGGGGGVDALKYGGAGYFGLRDGAGGDPGRLGGGQAVSGV